MNLERARLVKIPKVELHRHLECSIRVSTLKELAANAGIQVPTDEAEFRRRFLVTEPMRDLESVLGKFLMTQKVLGSEEALTRITREAIEDAAAEGIRILELRYAPTFIADGHPQLTFERIHRAIWAGREQARHVPVAVGFIAIIQRIRSVRDGELVTDFAIENRDSIVGLDLADNEASADSLVFAKAFAKARKAGLHITVHAGEANYPGAAKAVRDAIEALGAERIGHGLQIARDPKTVEFVAQRRVPLELCPTSNWLTNAVPTVKAHPFRKLMEAGVSVTVNSDDPGIFAIDLVGEYEALVRDLALTEVEFARCNDIAAANSFIPLAERTKYWPRPIDESLAAVKD